MNSDGANALDLKVLETLLAKLVLREQIGVRRAAGALIVLAGVVLVGG